MCMFETQSYQEIAKAQSSCNIRTFRTQEIFNFPGNFFHIPKNAIML